MPAAPSTALAAMLMLAATPVSGAVAVQTSPEQSGALGACLANISLDPDAALTAANAWLGKAKGAERGEAGECAASALVALGRLAEARSAYLSARDAAAPDDHSRRARLGAMAGNAALATGDNAAALAALDLARSDAGAVARAGASGGGAPVGPLAAGIAVDRARALVALGRDGEAAEALADARAGDPGNAEAWLLSGTLSRRRGKLVEAQDEIARAATLVPANAGVGPEVGLEAGVIAMLAGYEDAARKSWQSVLDAAPQSAAAVTARGYLAQIGPAASPASAPAAGR